MINFIIKLITLTSAMLILVFAFTSSPLFAGNTKTINTPFVTIDLPSNYQANCKELPTAARTENLSLPKQINVCAFIANDADRKHGATDIIITALSFPNSITMTRLNELAVSYLSDLYKDPQIKNKPTNLAAIAKDIKQTTIKGQTYLAYQHTEQDDTRIVYLYTPKTQPGRLVIAYYIILGQVNDELIKTSLATLVVK